MKNEIKTRALCTSFTISITAAVLSLGCGSDPAFQPLDEVSEPVINGTASAATAWPYMTGVVDRLYLEDDEIRQYCGATLVHPQWVLTAAHCLGNANAKAFIFGRKNLLDRTRGEEIWSDVESGPDYPGFPHENYNEQTNDSDIALVRLKSRAHVNTVELATPADTAAFGADETAAAMGWGFINAQTGEKSLTALREVSVPAILSADACNASTNWGPEGTDTVTQNQICVGALDGSKGVCLDDSGGPALVQNAGSWKQIGIVNYGHTSCTAANYPAVFTKVSNFYDWVYTRLPSQEAVGWFFTSDGAGALGSLRAYTGWHSRYHSIIPGEFGGDSTITDLAFYIQRSGEIALYTTDGAGGLTWLTTTTGLTKNGSIVVPGNFNGDVRHDLMIYDPVARHLLFYTPNAAGALTLLRRITGVRSTWRNIVPGNWGGSSHTDLAFYDPTDGVLSIYRTDGAGNLALVRTLTGLRKTIQLLVPGQFGGDAITDILYYDPTATGSSWNLAFYTFTDAGISTLLKTRAGFNRAVHTISPATFNTDLFTDLLFFDQDNRTLFTFSTDGSGNLTNMKNYGGIIASWPVVGNFGGSLHSDVFLYSRWNYGL